MDGVRHVSFGTKKAAAAVDDDDDDSYPSDEKIGTVAGTSTSNDSGIATGSLHVEVVRCADLQKPKVGTLYKAKMSGERVTPKVDAYVGNQHASTQTSRGVEPTFKEHFDFPGVTALDELVVRWRTRGESPSRREWASPRLGTNSWGAWWCR